MPADVGVGVLCVLVFSSSAAAAPLVPIPRRCDRRLREPVERPSDRTFV